MTEEEQGLLREVASLAADLGPALTPVDHEELLAAIVSAARRLFKAEACSLAVLDEDEEELVFHVAAGGSGDIVGLRLPVGQGIAGWVVASGQPIAIEDVSNDPRFARDVADTIGYVPRSILAMPLATERGVLGVIEILDWEGDAAERAEHMELLELYARQAALAIASARVFTELGRALFAAAALAAPSADLASALREVADDAPAPRAELAELAASFRELAGMGDDERRHASGLVADFLRGTSAGGPRETGLVLAVRRRPPGAGGAARPARGDHARVGVGGR